MKETLADILDRRQVNVAREKLGEWTGWAARARLAPFQKLSRTIRGHTDGILAYIATGLSNGRAEGVNAKLRTITKRSTASTDRGASSRSSSSAARASSCRSNTAFPSSRSWSAH